MIARYISFTNRVGFEWSLSSLPYGDKWRRSRRCFQQNFRKAVSHQYEPLQLIKVGNLLKALLTSLDEPNVHFKTCVFVSDIPINDI